MKTSQIIHACRDFNGFIKGQAPCKLTRCQDDLICLV